MEVKQFWRKKNKYKQRREEQTRENTNPQKRQTGSLVKARKVKALDCCLVVLHLEGRHLLAKNHGKRKS